MQRGGETYYYHFDGLGSVTALTNSSGEAVETYTYDVYGKPTTASSIGNPYLFTGREYDAETGLYYYRERYYSPESGRFLQTDPLEIDDENKYSYCYNDPVNYIDPYGLLSIDITRVNVDYPYGYTGTTGPIYIPLPPVELPPITFPVPGTNAPKNPKRISEGKETTKDKEEETLIGGFYNKAKEKAEGKEEKRGWWDRFKDWWKRWRGGREIVVRDRKGKVKFRFNPFGDSESKNPFGRRPHYHRRIIDPNTGQAKEGGGIGWHRPWERRW